MNEQAERDLDEFADALLASGVAYPHQIVGCTEAEIAAVLDKAQGFPLPEHFVAFLRRMGRRAGRLMTGTSAFYPEPLEATDAVREFAENEPALRVSGRFFFANHQGYQWYFFDESGKVFLHSEGDSEPQLLGESFLEFLRCEAHSSEQALAAGNGLDLRRASEPDRYAVYSRVWLVSKRFVEEGVPGGAAGTILEVHGDDAYEVDFSGTRGVPHAQVVTTRAELELIDADPRPPLTPAGFPKAPPVDPSQLRPSGTGWKVALSVGVPVLVLVVLSLVLARTTPPSPSAAGSQASKAVEVGSAVGDCLQGDVGNSHVTPIACGPGVRYKVIGRVEDQSELQLTMGTSACDPFPTANAIYWKGESGPIGGIGTLLCLEDTTVPTVPVTGDCLKGELSDTRSVAKVACGPDAAYQVIAREKSTSVRGLGGTPPCEQVPATSATYSWSWDNSPLASTSVLCLQDLKDPDKHAPVVGDCLTFPTDTSIHFVPCGKGKLKVLGKIAKTSQFDGAFKPASEICHDFPGSDRLYWHGFQNDLSGTTFCLDTLRK